MIKKKKKSWLMHTYPNLPNNARLSRSFFIRIFMKNKIQGWEKQEKKKQRAYQLLLIE